MLCVAHSSPLRVRACVCACTCCFPVVCCSLLPFTLPHLLRLVVSAPTSARGTLLQGCAIQRRASSASTSTRSTRACNFLSARKFVRPYGRRHTHTLAYTRTHTEHRQNTHTHTNTHTHAHTHTHTWSQPLCNSYDGRLQRCRRLKTPRHMEL